MSKTYILVLVVVLLSGIQTGFAQNRLDDVFAQLDAASKDGLLGATPAVVETPSSAAASPSAVGSKSDNLFAQGVNKFALGRYKDAEVMFESVLALDPYNAKAMIYLKRTAQRIADMEIKKHEASRARAIADVNRAWNPDLKATLPIMTTDNVDDVDSSTSAIKKMEDRLRGIMIPSLDFRDANINDVVLFLTETCRRLDAGGGVNILLLGMNAALIDQYKITISIRDMSLYEALQYIVEMASLKFEVKPGVVAISPVNYVAAADMIMKSYDIISEVGADMASLSGSGDGTTDDLFGNVAASDSSPAGPVDVTGFFSIIDFPVGATAVYQSRFHKLFVKNTPKNIQFLEAILRDLEDEAIKKRSQQVEIEAKFVEFNEGSLEELGFDWTVLGDVGEAGGFGLSDKGGPYYTTDSRPTISQDVADGSTVYLDPESGYRQITDGEAGSQSVFGTTQRSNKGRWNAVLGKYVGGAFNSAEAGILSSMGGTPASMLFENDDLLLRISAMEQAGTADVLSAPRITTKSGNEAIIRVVEVHRYPQDYEVETGQRTSPVVKPQDWESMDLGVVLKVTPIVDAESSTIELDLQPEITKFKGYDQYKVGANAYESGSTTTIQLFGDGSALIAKMPYFEKRSVQTQVTISDGHTVLMGGLVDERTETFRDQVPFLGDIPYIGRFFRTEGSRTAKKNLVIYVKATLVDDRGMTQVQRERFRGNMAN